MKHGKISKFYLRCSSISLIGMAFLLSEFDILLQKNGALFVCIYLCYTLEIKLLHLFTPYSPFISDKTSGVIKTKSRLDREKKENYILDIQVDDCGDPKLSERRTVRVKLSDINDNSPVFSYPSYTVHVREDESVQRVLPLRIHATGKQSYFDPLRPSSTLTRRRMFSPPPPFLTQRNIGISFTSPS